MAVNHAAARFEAAGSAQASATAAAAAAAEAEAASRRIEAATASRVLELESKLPELEEAKCGFVRKAHERALPLRC